MKRFRRFRLGSALLLLAAVPMSALAQAAREATLAESLSRSSIRAPAISPDARWVAYLQRETNWKENEFVWQLWLAEVESGRTVQITRGKKSIGAAEWSPDGRWLAFVTEREASVVEPLATVQKEVAKDTDKGDAAEPSKPAAKQVWAISPAGGEAWPVTKSD